MRNIFILLFLSPILLFAGLDFVPFSVDYAVFSRTDSAAYVEIYVSLFQRNLSYKQNNEGKYQASFKNTISIFQSDSLLQKYSHSYVSDLQDTTKESIELQQFNQLIDIFKLDMPFGKYKIKTQVTDLNTNKKGETVFNLNVSKNKSSFYFSSIELSSSIIKDTTQNIYYKNGLQVIPHPRRTYDILSPILYYYAELYGLNTGADKEGSYTTIFYVTNSVGDTLKKGNLRTKKIVSDAVVDMAGFNTMALPAGSYNLYVVARDNTNDNVASTHTNFKVYKPSKEKSENDENAYSLKNIDQIYISMNSNDLEAEFNVAKYIAGSQEKRIFESVKDQEGMKLFLTQFWHSRDKKDKLPFGTTRQKYLERTALANDKYGTGRYKGKGWKTDRGRVLITYGRPDEIQRNANTTDSQPYDVWIYYSLEGGAQFIFADLNGFGDYQLIHSTYRKELKNPDWKLLIQKTAGKSSNNNNNNNTNTLNMY